MRLMDVKVKEMSKNIILSHKSNVAGLKAGGGCVIVASLKPKASLPSPFDVPDVGHPGS